MREIAILNIDELNQNNIQENFYSNTLTAHLKENHARIEKPHRHNFYAVFLFTEGTGVHEIDFNRYEVLPGSVFLLAPGQTHSWELSEDAEGFVFFHTQEFIDLFYVREFLREYPIFRTSLYGNRIALSDVFYQTVYSLFTTIEEESKTMLWKKDSLVASTILQLYILLNRYVLQLGGDVKSQGSAYGVLLQRLEDLVDLHYKEHKSASFYAEKMAITTKHLNRVCMELVGKTTTTIILDRVVLEAKRQLLYTAKSFSGISMDLGYEDYSYFSRVFKKMVGETPKQFLKRYE